MPFSLSERSRSALEDILTNAQLCLEFTRGMDFQNFASDRKTYYAAIRCLEVISEASRKIDSDVCDRHPGIPWQLVRSAGNVYRHEYNDISESLVWETITVKLASLVEICQSELKPE